MKGKVWAMRLAIGEQRVAGSQTSKMRKDLRRVHKVPLHIDVDTIQVIYKPRHEISNNVVCATSKRSDQPAHTRSLILAFASRLNII